MSEIVRPVMRKCSVPAGWNHSACEPTAAREWEEPTGWIEVVTDNGLRAASRTEAGARQMIARMREARKPHPGSTS